MNHGKKAMPAIGVGPALGAKRGNGMASLAKVGTADRTSLAAIEDAAESTKTCDVTISAQEEDEPEGDRLSEEVEQLLMDIKTGKVKTTVYTFDEYMRYLDSIRDG